MNDLYDTMSDLTQINRAVELNIDIPIPVNLTFQ